MAEACSKTGQQIERLKQATRDEPNSATTWFELGAALLKIAPIQAEQALERAVEIDPALAKAWMNLGGLRAARMAFTGSLEACKKAAEADPALLGAHYNQGLSHMYLKQPTEMVDCFLRVLELDPDNAGGYYHLAVGLYALNRTQEARFKLACAIKLGWSPDPAFLQAVQQEPKGPVELFELGTGSTDNKESP